MNIQWHTAMASNGTHPIIQWHHSMASFNGTIQSFNGIQWHTSNHSMNIQWHTARRSSSVARSFFIFFSSLILLLLLLLLVFVLPPASLPSAFSPLSARPGRQPASAGPGRPCSPAGSVGRSSEQAAAPPSARADRSPCGRRSAPQPEAIRAGVWEARRGKQEAGRVAEGVSPLLRRHRPLHRRHLLDEGGLRKAAAAAAGLTIGCKANNRLRAKSAACGAQGGARKRRRPGLQSIAGLTIGCKATRAAGV